MSSICAGQSNVGNLGGPIDRAALVKRHCPQIDSVLPMSPMPLGNGSIVFTADFTGLQTFPRHYDAGVPLQTIAGWGWNRFPNEHKIPFASLFDTVDFHGREMTYLNADTQQKLYYRGDVHRFNLGRIGLDLRHTGGKAADIDAVDDIDQHLDLWSGLCQSRFTFEKTPVHVSTVMHPEEDILAIKVQSPLVGRKRCNIRIEFPYPAGTKHLPTDLFEDSMRPRWFNSEGWELLNEPFFVDVLDQQLPFRIYRKLLPVGRHIQARKNSLVSVCFFEGAKQLPDWLRAPAWKRTNEFVTIAVGDSMTRFRVFTRPVAKNDTLVLGGNARDITGARGLFRHQQADRRAPTKTKLAASI